MTVSEDFFERFMEKKGFKLDEAEYFFRKIGDAWLNCNSGVNVYNGHTYFEIIATSPDGEDLFRKSYDDFEEFESIITRVIREERFKIILDE